MNRTIKFRGKRVYGKGWVIGYYVYRPDGKHLIYWKPFNEATQNTYHEVIPETVGQFTGLNDKNGKEIYEGDIVTDNVGNDGVVKWDHLNCRFIVFWDRANNEGLIKWLSESIEITGNIHDND